MTKTTALLRAVRYQGCFLQTVTSANEVVGCTCASATGPALEAVGYSTGGNALLESLYNHLE